MRNPQTIAKLRAMSSPDKLRALLLREDELARTGMLPEPPPASEFKPRLDKTLRLRAIRRLRRGPAGRGRRGGAEEEVAGQERQEGVEPRPAAGPARVVAS